MLIGYARVSTLDQNTRAQVEALRRAGVSVIHQEKRSAVKDRPVLDRLIQSLRPGDVLVVYKLDRLARSMSHFVRVFDALKVQGAGFRSLTEAIETDTPQGRMFLHLLSAFAEFERELIRERCLAGQRAARAAGKTWGRVSSIPPEDAAYLARCWRRGWFQRDLADAWGVHEATLRDAIHRHERRGRYAPLQQ